MSITEKRLDEIRERLDAATPGPWRPDNDEPGYVIAPGDPSGWDGYLIASTVDHDGGLFVQEHNAELIAHAPQDLADLLAEVERLRGVLAKAREVTEEKVEKGGVAANDVGWTCYGGAHEPGSYHECPECKKVSDQLARCVLTAALGGGDDA